jgi:polyhydroxyalkanoate synthesis repressor PhaR
VAEAAGRDKLIRRYDNRKLYDPEDRRYVTLSDLARMVSEGRDVRVVDQASGEDLSGVVLAQVVLEILKERTAAIPRQVLTRLIRLAARPGTRWTTTVAETAGRAREEAERIATALVNRGRLSLEEALGLRQEIADSLQRLAGDVQHGVEGRLRRLVEATSPAGPGVEEALAALKRRLMTFEEYLEETPRPEATRRRRVTTSSRARKREEKFP